MAQRLRAPLCRLFSHARAAARGHGDSLSRPLRSFLHTTPSCFGRVVTTHSTHIDGLLDVLREVAKQAYVSTIVPARLSRGAGSSSGLSVRVSMPTEMPTGWKCIARKGSQLQEVFVVTHESAETLQAELDTVCAGTGGRRGGGKAALAGRAAKT